MQIVGWIRVIFWRVELRVTIFRFRVARFRSTLFDRRLEVSQELL